MLDLTELEQLVAFADCGTLSGAAEQLHISQPTITRTMQHLEEEFNVSLFQRRKNRISLNQTGQKAVEYARKLLFEAEQAVLQVQSYDRHLRTIQVESCAPAPLWYLLPPLSGAYPEMTISSSLTEASTILDHLRTGRCDIGILTSPVTSDELKSSCFLKESLSICLPVGHALAERKSVSLNMLNGFNCLLRSDLGFWSELCYEKMPASRFLIQTDEFAFRELVRESALPCFTTNLAGQDMTEELKNRNIIPVTDEEANVTYYLVYRKNKTELRMLQQVLEEAKKR